MVCRGREQVERMRDGLGYLAQRAMPGRSFKSIRPTCAGPDGREWTPRTASSTPPDNAVPT